MRNDSDSSSTARIETAGAGRRPSGRNTENVKRKFYSKVRKLHIFLQILWLSPFALAYGKSETANIRQVTNITINSHDNTQKQTFFYLGLV